MKRFYQQVTVEVKDQQYHVLLDGKPLKTQSGDVLHMASEPLAEAVAEEWDAQGDALDMEAMLLMRMVSAVQEIGEQEQATYREEILKFGQTDALCYRESEEALLKQQQTDMWDPLLKWMDQQFDVRLDVTEGIMPVSQSEESMEKLRHYVISLSPVRLFALYVLTQSLGSVVLGIAMLEDKLDASQALAYAHLEQDFQIEKWGTDEEVMQRRRTLSQEVMAVEYYLSLVGEV